MKESQGLPAKVEATAMPAGKHLWMINHYASRPDEAGIRHYSLARGLLGQGWTTSIIACSTQHNTGRQRMRGRKIQETERIDDVTYRWLRMPKYASNGIFRVLNMVGFAMFLLAPGATRGLTRPDVIIGSTVHPLAAFAAAKLARRLRVPFVFEIRDLWPETLVELGNLRRTSLPAKLLYRLERWLCDQAMTVITTMPFAGDYLASRGVDATKVEWISNGVWPEEFDSVDHSRSGGDDFRFVYFGSIGAANCVEELVYGFSYADLPHIASFSIFGAGPKTDDVAAIISSLGLTGRVLLEGEVARHEVAKVAASADCLVLALRDTPLYNYGISLNKLFEYMAAGRPLVMAGHARGNPILASGGGVCCDPNAESIGVAMRAVFALSDEERALMGARNRRDVMEHFDFAVLSSKLDRILTDAITS